MWGAGKGADRDREMRPWEDTVTWQPSTSQGEMAREKPRQPRLWSWTYNLQTVRKQNVLGKGAQVGPFVKSAPDCYTYSSTRGVILPFPSSWCAELLNSHKNISFALALSRVNPAGKLEVFSARAFLNYWGYRKQNHARRCLSRSEPMFCKHEDLSSSVTLK